MEKMPLPPSGGIRTFPRHIGFLRRIGGMIALGGPNVIGTSWLVFGTEVNERVKLLV